MTGMKASVDLAIAEAVFRQESSAVLGALMRQYGNLDLAEDGYQEACLQAWKQWPREGLPDRPGAWLTTVARRRVIDRVRREGLRAEREQAAQMSQAEHWVDHESHAFLDDQLLLFFMCAHPALSEESRIALTLRSVAGLTTAEIARGFLVPEQTMAQRLVRAKRKIAATKIPFDVSTQEIPDRMTSVCHVLYLVFNEGYASSGVDVFVRTDLCDEAVNLARLLVRLAPDDMEALGLLALMMFHDARRLSRMGTTGELIPLEFQDRSLWDRAAIDEADRIVSTALANGPLGPYKLQAAIAAVHAQALTYGETDWVQILALYDLLITVDDGPASRLGRVVAVSMVSGSGVGLEALAELDPERGGLAHRWHAVRAHLLDGAGREQEAIAAYGVAADLARNGAEAEYLRSRAARRGPP